MQKPLYKEFENYIDDSKYKDSLEKLMKYVVTLINENGLNPSELEIKILGNHLSEMVNRAEKGKKLEPVDKELFAKVSEKSLFISQKTIDYISENIGPISDTETYLLSIHFENMDLD